MKLELKQIKIIGRESLKWQLRINKIQDKMNNVAYNLTYDWHLLWY